MSAGPILRTEDREERIAAWMEQERQSVIDAFGVAAWPVVEAFINSVPWESDADGALAKASEQLLMRPGRQMTPEESARTVAGRRTVAAMTPYEREFFIAQRLGMRVERVGYEIRRVLAGYGIKSERDQMDETLGADTALYRHYDAEGTLLYLGITGSPSLRAEQHRDRSPWWRFVADTTVEWFVSRDAATEAERDAIHDELPVFNGTHNKANRDAQAAYLFAALEKAGAA